MERDRLWQNNLWNSSDRLCGNAVRKLTANSLTIRAWELGRNLRLLELSKEPDLLLKSLDLGLKSVVVLFQLVNARIVGGRRKLTPLIEQAPNLAFAVADVQ